MDMCSSLLMHLCEVVVLSDIRKWIEENHGEKGSNPQSSIASASVIATR